MNCLDRRLLWKNSSLGWEILLLLDNSCRLVFRNHFQCIHCKLIWLFQFIVDLFEGPEQRARPLMLYQTKSCWPSIGCVLAPYVPFSVQLIDWICVTAFSFMPIQVRVRIRTQDSCPELVWCLCFWHSNLRNLLSIRLGRHFIHCRVLSCFRLWSS